MILISIRWTGTKCSSNFNRSHVMYPSEWEFSGVTSKFLRTYIVKTLQATHVNTVLVSVLRLSSKHKDSLAGLLAWLLTLMLSCRHRGVPGAQRQTWQVYTELKCQQCSLLANTDERKEDKQHTRHQTPLYILFYGTFSWTCICIFQSPASYK